MQMKSYDLYVFFLCFIVFVVFTALFSFLICEIIKLNVKLIKYGVEDERIVRECEKVITPTIKNTIGNICSMALTGMLIICFVFSLWLHFSENTFIMPTTLKVVASSSMATKNEANKYLFDNDLNNQLGMFDLIVTNTPPDEFDLQKYDIVVYECNGDYIIHRIVNIIEPNESHPTSRLFVLQGDAVDSPDKGYVSYEQIKAIYKDKHIPFIGSFVFFMKSPAGWLCILLILFTTIATPIVEKRIKNEESNRLKKIKKTDDEQEVTEHDGDVDIEEHISE